MWNGYKKETQTLLFQGDWGWDELHNCLFGYLSQWETQGQISKKSVCRKVFLKHVKFQLYRKCPTKVIWNDEELAKDINTNEWVFTHQT